MSKTKVIYWVCTSLFVFFMLGSAIPDVMMSPIAIKGMHTDLGYPLYFIPFIGIAKIAGSVTILVPGYTRIKEWAYAGLIFDLIGATYSVIVAGSPVTAWLFMIIPLFFGTMSYIYYHKLARTITRQVTVSQKLINNNL